MGQIPLKIKTKINTGIINYKVSKVINLYNRQKYQKIPSYFKNAQDYSKIKADQFPFLYFLISEANEEAIKVFVNKVSFKEHLRIDDTNPLKCNAITFSALQGKTNLIPIFQQIGANLQIPNSQGQNLLHLSAIYRRKQAFDYGITHSIDYNYQDQYGNTPFHYVCRTGIVQMISTMILSKAKKLQNKSFQYPIHMAIQSGLFPAYKLLANDVNGKYPKFHPIHSAARCNNIEIFKQILNKNPLLINYTDFKKLTPLHHAVIVNDLQMVRLIIKQKQMQINPQDQYGNTPLHLAILNKNSEIAQILIKAKANLDIKNQDYMSPTQYGLSCDIPAIRGFLKQFAKTSKDVKQWGTNMKY